MPTLADQYVLVTGGHGFIGRAVVAGLRSAGARVRIVDYAPGPSKPGVGPASPVPPPASGISADTASGISADTASGISADTASGISADTVVGDLRDPAVRDAAVTADLTGIVHLAAITSVLGSLADPAGAHELNVTATAGLLELARRRGVDRFVMTSTNAVTGDVGQATIDETMPLRPLTPYGATKAAAEMLLSGYAGGYGMTTCALRLTNVYGPGMAAKDSFVPRLMRAANADTAVEVYGDGHQRRDLVHVDDVVGGLLAAWHAGHTGPLIVGSGRSIRVLDLIAAVERVVGRDIARTHGPAKSGEMPAVIVSIDRARSLGYAPTVALEDGLATVWADLRA